MELKTLCHIFHGHGCSIRASAAVTRQPASGFEGEKLTTCPRYVRRLTKVSQGDDK